MNAILAAALHYAARGLAVFPVPPDCKKSYKCAKHSDGRKWGATRDPGEVRQDFTRFAGCRIGIPTGAGNRIVVVETDTVEGHGVDGAASLAKLESEHGRLPNTLAAISPTGSVHSYLQHPHNGIKIRNSASEIGAGIDVRGDGGMVIVPPSINPDGRAYRWLNRLRPAPMPAWLIELTREKPRTISQRAVAAIKTPFHKSGNGDFGSASAAYGAAALDDEIGQLANTAPGSRNCALNRAAFSLFQLVAGGELDEATVLNGLMAACTANGLIADDGLRSVMVTIESGRRAGLQYPRSRPEAR